VDGSDPRTEWRGVLSIDESPNSINPPNGWVFNSNNWPWSAAGPNSPKRENFPRYVEISTEESSRGRHALKVLPGKKDFTIASLISAAYDSWLPSFARMIPGLLASYDKLPPGDSLRARLAAPIAALRAWDYRWAANSIPTSVAVFWGENVQSRVAAAARRAGMSAETYVIDRATDSERLQSLVAAVTRLEQDFGRWQTPWGEINRFQRITDDIAPKFDDSAPSIPVPFTSARWGSLASFAARAYPGTKKWYGTSGNSFVAVIEFGDSVRARAITAGGESGNPSSPHFNDEALRYSQGLCIFRQAEHRGLVLLDEAAQILPGRRARGGKIDMTLPEPGSVPILEVPHQRQWLRIMHDHDIAVFNVISDGIFKCHLLEDYLLPIG